MCFAVASLLYRFANKFCHQKSNVTIMTISISTFSGQWDVVLNNGWTDGLACLLGVYHDLVMPSWLMSSIISHAMPVDQMPLKQCLQVHLHRDLFFSPKSDTLWTRHTTDDHRRQIIWMIWQRVIRFERHYLMNYWSVNLVGLSSMKLILINYVYTIFKFEQYS